MLARGGMLLKGRPSRWWLVVEWCQYRGSKSGGILADERRGHLYSTRAAAVRRFGLSYLFQSPGRLGHRRAEFRTFEGSTASGDIPGRMKASWQKTRADGAADAQS